MRYILCLVVAALCVEVNAAGCPNGRCSVKQPVRTVTKGTVQTVRNLGQGAVRVVTPPYRSSRCVNGKCNLR